jgi:prepilin-type processing-associated H-X9-DG protein
LAVHHYENVNGCLPPNGSYDTNLSNPHFGGVPYAVHARLLPFLEQPALAARVDLSGSAAGQPDVISQRIGVYFCPSDANDRPSTGLRPTYPTTYGAAFGDWFSEDVKTARFGNGAFPGVSYPSQNGIKLGDISDGASETVGFSEVKAFTPLLLLTANLSPTAIPTTPSEVVAYGGTLQAQTEGTSWAYPLVQYTGLSFVFPPNTVVPFFNPADGQTYDVQWPLGGNVVYAAITARSYHPGGVNALLMDGSARFVTNSISQATWRALGTRNGGEAVGDF